MEIEPEKFSIRELRESNNFLQKIRWDMTPKTWFKPPPSMPSIDGFMLYIDIVDGKPVLMIMKNISAVSETMGYVTDAPEGLLKEALNCGREECMSGMYPITKKIEDWLKKELGLS